VQKELAEARDQANGVLTAAELRVKALTDWVAALAQPTQELSGIAEELNVIAASAAAATFSSGGWMPSSPIRTRVGRDRLCPTPGRPA